MQSKQYFTKIKNYPHEKSTEPNFIFQSESYIYMKVADNGIKYMQIPVSIRGTYNPKSHDASFTYKL